MSDPAIQSDDRSSGSVAPTLVQTIAQAPSVVPEVPEPQASSKSKESGSRAVIESVPIVEVGASLSGVEQEPIPEAVEAWMEKVGEEEASVQLESLPPVQIPPPAPTTTSSQPIFVLPLGQSQMQIGLHASVNDSIRWLATWAQRMMKQLKGQTVFERN